MNYVMKSIISKNNQSPPRATLRLKRTKSERKKFEDSLKKRPRSLLCRLGIHKMKKTPSYYGITILAKECVRCKHIRVFNIKKQKVRS